jgi:predicted RNA-binding protein with PIN domain
VALVRILVDGYSLLHAWPDLARGKARYSSAARAELIQQLRQYGDAIGTPVTVVFDGKGPPEASSEPGSTPAMEIIYSKSGKTADDIIERAAALLVKYGEVLVVSNDFAERDTVASVGGSVCSCEHFIHSIGASINDFQKQVQRHNASELKRYRKK